ncbi:MAG TPA: SusC/RagA family TonB-linked outer membrane protein, partial [Chitinophagaceae bacterium]|nr:SusC/RagA family TonB-linked outer membrane protein [Chitinophagaceae bacterium]
KGFDFSMFWQGVGKRDLMLSDNLYWGFITQVQSSIFKDHLNYYRDVDATKYAGLGKNTDAYFARPYLDGAMNGKNQISQTRYLQDASYVRLKNLQIGYTLPAKLAQIGKLQNVYVYVSGENLVTYSKLPSHFDPENANIGLRGAGKSFFPQQALTFGVNLKF